MQTRTFPWRRAITLAALALLVYTIAANAWLNHRFFVSSFLEFDGAGEIGLARQIADDGRWVYTQNWYYSTELRTVHNQLVMSALFRFSDNALLVHLVSTVLINCLTAGAALGALLLVGSPLWAALLGGALFATPFSYEVFNILIADNYYNFFLLLSVLFAALFLRLYIARDIRYVARGTRKRWLAFGGLVLTSLVLGLCGVRYLLVLYAPLGLLVLLLCLRRVDLGIGPLAKAAVTGKPRWNDPAWAGLGRYLACLATHGAGLLLYWRVLCPRFGVDGALGGSMKFSSRPDIFAKLTGTLPAALLNVFAPLYSENLYGLLGLLELAGLVCVCLLAASMVWLAVRWRGLPHLQRYFVAFAWLCFGVNMLLLVLTEDAHHGGAVISERYVLLGAYPLLLLPPIALGDLARRVKAGRGGAAARPVSALGALALAVCISLAANPVSMWQLCGAAQNPKGLDGLPEAVEYLQENGYRYGFGIFAAGVAEVLSSFELKVCGVEPEDGDFVRNPWLQSHESYAGNYEETRQFLLLRQSDKLPERLAELQVLYENEGFVIYAAEPWDIIEPLAG